MREWRKGVREEVRGRRWREEMEEAPHAVPHPAFVSCTVALADLHRRPALLLHAGHRGVRVLDGAIGELANVRPEVLLPARGGPMREK